MRPVPERATKRRGEGPPATWSTRSRRRLVLSLSTAALLTAACTGLEPAANRSPRAAEADALVAAGETARAAEIYSALAADDAQPDRALLLLAVLELDRTSSPFDPSAAFARLERLVVDYPSSPYLPVARALLALRGRAEELEAEVKGLAERLEALKRIDLDPPDG